jgi:DNA polymerase-3 subunit epsilon
MKLGLSRRRPHGAAAVYASARLPARRTPWREAHWCALDFELTGLDPRNDEIISFGAVPIDAGRLQLAGAVAGLVRPERESSDAAIRVHGIRTADLHLSPPLADAIGPLLATIAGRGLIAHAAFIEREFLGQALRGQGARFRGPIVDTQLLGQLWLYERDGRLRQRMALAELAAELGLPADRQHDALADAQTTAQVFLALATHLDARRPETVASLAGADRRLDGLRVFQGQ